MALEGSLTVYRLFGNGSRQGVLANGWQSAPGAAASAAGATAIRPTTSTVAPITRASAPLARIPFERFTSMPLLPLAFDACADQAYKRLRGDLS